MDKLLVVCISNSQGGMESVVLSDCKLLSNDFDVTLLAYENSYLAKNSSVKVTTLKRMSNYFDWQSIQFIDFDYIYIHQSGLLGNFRFIRSFSKFKKIVFHSHIMTEVRKKSFFHQFLYGGIDEVFGISEEHVVNLRNHLPLGLKINWIPLALELPDVSQTDMGKKSKRCVCISRVDPQKGQDFLLEIFSELPDWSLDIIGGPTPGQEEYFNNLKRKAPSNVHFLGFLPQKEIWAKLINYQVAFMPSRRETLGLAALESLCLGVPTLCFETGSSKDLEDFATRLSDSKQEWIDTLRNKSYKIPDSFRLKAKYSSNNRKSILIHSLTN